MLSHVPTQFSPAQVVNSVRSLFAGFAQTLTMIRAGERTALRRLPGEEQFPDEPDSGLRLPSRTNSLFLIGRVIVMAQIKLPVMIHQAESHAIEPPSSSKHIARHRGIFGEINGCLHLDTKYAQSNSMRIREEAASNRRNPRRGA